MHQQTLILGIGNTLLCDEGAGIHALHRLEQHLADRDDILTIDGGTLSFTLAHYIEDSDKLIVLDAAQLQAPAGSVQSFEGADMDHFLGHTKRSPHEVGLLDLLDIARITGSLPEHRALIGIQPESIDWSMQPTEAVAEALPLAVSTALDILCRWNVLDDTFGYPRPQAGGSADAAHGGEIDARR